VLLIVITVCLSSPVYGDLIIFKDKNAVVGAVLEFSDGKFKVKVKEEIVFFNAEDIKRIYFPSEEQRKQLAEEPAQEQSEPLPSQKEEEKEKREEVTRTISGDKIQSLEKNPLLEQADAFYNEAEGCFSDGDYKSAIKLYEKSQKYLRKLLRETKDREVKERYKAKYQRIESAIKRARAERNKGF
jgi:hypothetical protein